jgi:transcription elongation factor Elf1
MLNHIKHFFKRGTTCTPHVTQVAPLMDEVANKAITVCEAFLRYELYHPHTPEGIETYGYVLDAVDAYATARNKHDKAIEERECANGRYV